MSHNEPNHRALALAALAVAALKFILLPQAAHAQRPFAFEVRVGAAASSVLAADSVVRQSVLDRLAGKGHVAEELRARPTVAPTIQLSVRTLLRPDLQLEGTAGWSFGRLGAGSVASYQSFNAGSGTIGLRYALRPRIYVRGGFGAIHYSSAAKGLFQQGGALEPVVEAGIGSAANLSIGSVSIEAFGQAHRFGTTSLRQIGGSDGTVIRGGVLVGVATGGRR